MTSPASGATESANALANKAQRAETTSLIADARHRGLFSWATAVYDRAVLQKQKPTQAGGLYRRAIKASVWRYGADVRRGADTLSDDELANLVQLLMRQESTLTFTGIVRNACVCSRACATAWRNVQLRRPLLAFAWAQCHGIAPSQVAAIVSCTSHLQSLSMAGCTTV